MTNMLGISAGHTFDASNTTMRIPSKSSMVFDSETLSFVIMQFSVKTIHIRVGASWLKVVEYPH